MGPGFRRDDAKGYAAAHPLPFVLSEVEAQDPNPGPSTSLMANG
jgi:hypothetical protein